MWQMRKIRLWEKVGWIIIRSRETARKLGLYMEKERDMRYEKFQTTGQERIRSGKRTWGKWSSWRVLAGLEQKNWRILSVLPEESESWRAWCG